MINLLWATFINKRSNLLLFKELSDEFIIQLTEIEKMQKI
jgi:hypothetical protein